MPEQRFAGCGRTTRFWLCVAIASILAVSLIAALGASQATAYSQAYAVGLLSPYPSSYNHGSFNSIIYNRSQVDTYANNNCVYMKTDAGSIRAGTIVCDSNSDGEARECLGSATPMSKGFTYLVSAADTNSSVVNNTTYDSGCAV